MNLKNNEPVFLHPAFCNPYFGPDFFSGSQSDPYFQNKNSGCRCTGRLLAQSICTHYSCFENMGRFVTLKKGPKYGLQKAGCKKQDHCYSKRGKSVDETNLARRQVYENEDSRIRNYFTRLCTPAEKYCMCPSKDAKCKKIAPIHYYKRTYVCHSSRSLTTFEICIRYCLSDNSPPVYLHLIFEISSVTRFFFNFEISSLKSRKVNLISKLNFAGYTGSKNQVWTRKKIKFDLKSIFFFWVCNKLPNWHFKNQAQIDTTNVYNLMPDLLRLIQC